MQAERRTDNTSGTDYSPTAALVAALVSRTCSSGWMSGHLTDSSPGRRLRVTTEQMAYGPHAVARHGGKVLFVRGAAPREEVEVAIRDERRRFAYAETLAVLRSSAARRSPPCPYLPRCGGCPWQHLRYDAQLAAKQSIVREQIRRIAGIDVAVAPVAASPREYSCRQRIKLRVGEDGAVGFHAAASHAVVGVEHCLLAETPVDAAIVSTSAFVRSLQTRIRRIELLGRGGREGGVVVAGEAEGAWAARDEGDCRAWLSAQRAVHGLRLSGRGWHRTWGDPRIAVLSEPDVPLWVQAQTFTQVNPGANRLLVETVVRLVEPAPGRRVLDLYAGAGNLSLALVRRGASVVAVEQQRQAAEDGRANAARVCGGEYRARCARADRALEELNTAGARFDVAVLDPPRSGAALALAGLMRLAPPRLVYVSCDPATLARDLRVLEQRYRVEEVQPIDMFPHTYHVETVVRAKLAS